MILNARIVVGHHISSTSIIVDPSKIKVIINKEITALQREVRSFMGHVGYYICFINFFTNISLPLFKLLAK